MATIQVIVVLYQRAFHQSESLSSFLPILYRRPDWAAQFSLLIYDNSPQPQAIPAQAAFPVGYVHDPGNGGLAVAYNAALARAVAEGIEWILLLDQDTSLSMEFVGELLEVTRSLDARPEVGGIVPKLMVRDAIHSPASSFLTQLRQIRSPGESIYLEAVGVQPQHLVSYNSGATLRVSALRAIGGFPREFWLDFLDHAVFHTFFLHGFRVYLMKARLAHDFSGSEVESVPTWRQLNVLNSRTLYVLQRGTLIDRWLYRLWLLRHARALRKSGAEAQVWRTTALRAFRLGKKDKR